MRKGTYKWRPRNEALSEARVERGKYRCAGCKEIVGRKEIQIDHKDPVVDPKVGWVSLDLYAERMFCEKENLQALCKTKCHSEKSRLERGEAAQRRANEKKKKLDKG